MLLADLFSQPIIILATSSPVGNIFVFRRPRHVTLLYHTSSSLCDFTLDTTAHLLLTIVNFSNLTNDELAVTAYLGNPSDDNARLCQHHPRQTA